MPPPLVSVILPCRDVAGYAGAAVASLKAQSFADFEVICIDDGSTDGTGDVLRAGVAGDPRFQIVTNGSPRGLSAARNQGLERARAPLIAFLDGDDRYAPAFLARMVKALDDSHADWVACAVSLVWPDGASAAHSAIHGAPAPMGEARSLPLDDAREIARLFPSAWNKLYRREFIGQTRFIDGALFEDHPFFWELACKTSAIQYLPDPLYLHLRGRAGQITAQTGEAAFEKLERLQEVAAILTRADKHAKQDGLSQLATRLVHERLEVMRDPALRAQFLAQAARKFDVLGLHWDRAGAADIDPSAAPMLDPTMRLSVLCMGADPCLQDQRLPPWQVLATDNLAQALGQVTSPWVAVLRGGDLPAPDWALSMLEAVRGADYAFCGAEMAGATLMADGPSAPAMMILKPSDLAGFLEQAQDIPAPVFFVWLAHALRESDLRGAHVNRPLVSLAPRDPLPLMHCARLARGLPPMAAAMAFAENAFLHQLTAPNRAARGLRAMGAGMVRLLFRLPNPPYMPHLGRALRLCLNMRAPCGQGAKGVRLGPKGRG